MQFNITLAAIICEFDLTEEQIKQLGIMTAKREIAHYISGGEVFYRRGTIERMYSKPSTQE